MQVIESIWKEKSEELFKDMAEWRKSYKHKNPCLDYKQSGFCKHLVKARTRNFEKRITEQLQALA